MIDSIEPDNVIKYKETDNDLTIHLESFQHRFRENFEVGAGVYSFSQFELYGRTLRPTPYSFAVLSCVLAAMCTGLPLIVYCLKN
jgi:hypothetical protein